MTAMDRLAKLETQFSPDQARVLMDTLEGQSVTRDYVKAEVQQLRTELQEVRGNLIVWMVGLTLGSVAVTVGAAFTILSRLPK